MPTKSALPPTQLTTLDPEQIPIQSQVLVLCGHSSQLHPLILQSLFLRAAREPIGVLIGDNRFDAYTLAQFARRCEIDPSALLKRIEFSRAFTCHQLHHGVMNLITPKIKSWRSLYVLGLVRLFDDEDIPYAEAVRLLDEILTRLHAVAAEGLAVLVTVSPPKIAARGELVDRVLHSAHAYWQPSPLVVEEFAKRQTTLW